MLNQAKKHYNEMVDHAVDLYKASARFTRALAKELPKHRNTLHNKLDEFLDHLESDSDALDVDSFDAAMDLAGKKMKDQFAEIVDV